MSFAHQSLVEFIRDALWRQKPGTTIGRAAIMVGAGFSKNANPTSSAARPFPSWPALTESLCSRLYPVSDPARHVAALKEAAGTSGALRLAQEYEAVFGRFQLDEFVRSAIPDGDHHPGELHVRLLSLPWADVFTTNWDTLLERAQIDVFGRAYDVVRTPSQIPSAAVPRIVKLHGSLPAHQPFVFAEEDYRTYPVRFAPFVNLVQQAMMENTFILLGFSGDDPNFLHWSGWVRDNLGAQAPKIYLVGWLELSPQRRRMMEDRNVVPLDLSDLPQGRDWPKDLHHRYATEWFIRSLELGRPPRPSLWPAVPRPRAAVSDHLGPIPAPAGMSSSDEPWPKTNFQSSAADRAEDLARAAEAWAKNRVIYPGWLVAPSSVRARVWSGTLHWAGGIRSAVEALDPRRRLSVMGELLWRLDVALVGFSVDPEIETLLRETLEVADARARCLKCPNGMEVHLDAGEWAVVQAGYAELARCARTRGDKEAFERWLARLATASLGNANIGHSVRYERCLWSLQRLEHSGLERLLDSWDVDGADPIWAMRKAGMLAGIERMGEARSVFRLALSRLRRERRRDVEDHAAMSREAWALWLALAFQPRSGTETDPTGVIEPDPFDRWRELSLHDCNAFADYHGLRSDQERAEDVPSGAASQTRRFDLGHVSRTQHFRTGLPRGVLASLQLLRLSEVTGLPASANNMSVLHEGLEGAVGTLADSDAWACATLSMRLASSGSDKVLDRFFTRARVALLDAGHIDQLRDVLEAAVDHAWPRSRRPNDRADYWLTRLQVSLEVLSRVTLRFTPDRVEVILSKAIALYRQEWPVGDLRLSSELNSLFGRAIETLPLPHLRSRLRDLAELPLPGTGAFLRAGPPGHWQDPLEHVPISHRSASTMQEARGDAAWRPVVRRLLADAGESAVARRHAVGRLHRLRHWGILDEEEISAFAAVVWDPAYLLPDGLPGSLELHPWVALLLPEIRTGQAADAFRRTYLRAGTTGATVADSLWNVGLALCETKALPAAFRLDEEDHAALARMIDAWAKEAAPKRRLQPWDEASGRGGAVTGLGYVLASSTFGCDLMGEVWRKVEELEADQGGVVRAYTLYAGLARASPERVAELAQRLRRALVVDNSDVAADAATGLYRWLQAADEEPSVPAVPDDLVQEIGTAIAARRRSILVVALALARWLLEFGPGRYRSLVTESCEHGLAYLFVEASYSAGVARASASGIDTPLLRRNCVRLARAMRDAGLGDREAVGSWLDAAQTDPLPEVRNLVAGDFDGAGAASATEW